MCVNRIRCFPQLLHNAQVKFRYSYGWLLNGGNINLCERFTCRAETVRSMLGWVHGKFRERLTANAAKSGERYYPVRGVYFQNMLLVWE